MISKIVHSLTTLYEFPAPTFYCHELHKTIRIVEDGTRTEIQLGCKGE